MDKKLDLRKEMKENNKINYGNANCVIIEIVKTETVRSRYRIKT